MPLHTIWLPMVFGGMSRSHVGLCTPALHQFLLPDNMVPGAFVRLADAVKESNAGWIRVYISWKDIEKTPGNYDFRWYDEALAIATSCHAYVLANVARSPLWCAPTPGEPIYEDRLPDYERFLTALVNRYKVSPFNIRAWEIENEPDGILPEMWPYGISCWGNHGDQYARLLQHARAAIKSADADALVVFGGVAHENTPAFNIGFVESVLQAGGGQFVDVMNFHYYWTFAWYWQSRMCSGGLLDIAAKAACFRQLCASYGFSGPVWCTETGYPGIAGNEESLQAQANYVDFVYATGMAAGLAKIFYFAIDTPVEAGSHLGLVTPEWLPKPAFWSFAGNDPIPDDPLSRAILPNRGLRRK